ncbi:hypothetical protein AALB_3026 [Agarivorans albus MKT 106]|uniref:Uncharacterized protein n=1 Tax=Agarivorans albus MKT 106 TaxID=1331007 RepID=R9PTS8_AGAAL|nr:hypothetical protein AALB_3026 [Agarivorans albus MKT 106]
MKKGVNKKLSINNRVGIITQAFYWLKQSIEGILVTLLII